MSGFETEHYRKVSEELIRQTGELVYMEDGCVCVSISSEIAAVTIVESEGGD